MAIPSEVDVNTVCIVVTDPEIKQQLGRNNRTVASIRDTSLAAFGDSFSGADWHSVLKAVQRLGYMNSIFVGEAGISYIVVAVRGGQLEHIAQELSDRLSAHA